MTYDTAAYYNSAMAIVAGVGVAAFSFRLIPPLSPAFRTRRLLALTLRDAWTHHDPKLHARPASHYGLDSAKDAAVVLLTVLASQALMLETSQESALPQAALCRATAVLVPLIATVRMALRPKPVPKLPFQKMTL